MNEIKFGDNQFCGPSVISAIAGITTDEAAAVLSSITGAKVIKGVYITDLAKAFDVLGYNSERILKWTGNSVFSSLFGLHGKDGSYVFQVPGHFIAIESNKNHKFICDNRTKEPINVANSARLGQRVVAILKVIKR